METLEKSCMCRLCGKQSGISINIFDKNESHVRKINAILPILVHEMDLLPKQMCHRCSYKLEEFYNFYVECAKTDSELKSQLSWMRKEDLEEKIITPMVKMSRFKIKTEPPDTDSKDPDNVFGQLNEGSLLFPTSILNHGYFPSSSPIISCSRCRCLCNTNIKIGKTSPKNSPSNNKIQAHSSNSPDTINDVSISDKSKSVKVNLTKEFSGEDNIQEVSVKENSFVNFENSFHSDDNDEKSNRALRPRKSSVDYVGPKKKRVIGGLKTNITNKLSITDPTLKNSVNIPNQIKTCPNNQVVTSNHCPIIKLEKVDDTMKMLRTKKNLEEFNKRIKEFQKERKGKRENQKKISFKKEEDLKRKSEHKETFRKRNSLKTENTLRTTLLTESNIDKPSLFLKDDDEKKKSVLKNQHVKRKSLDITLATEESSMKERFEIETSLKNKQYLSSIVKCDSTESAIRVPESQIKQEDIKDAGNDESLAKQMVKEQLNEVEVLNVKKSPKPLDKISLCSVVKLEKDYTCNVEYPRIKIKRHITFSSPSKMQESGSIEDGSILKLTTEKKSPVDGTSTDSFSKSLRSKNKQLRELKDRKKSKAFLKKKNKHLDLAKVKRMILDKGISVVASQTDFKRYCEECDACFKTNELFNLHPCYQK